MKGIILWILRWRGMPVVAVGLVIVGAGTLIARGASTSDGADAGSDSAVATGGGILALGVVAALFVLVALRVAVMFAGVDPDAASIAAGLTAYPDEQRLLTRWLERTRWARNVGGFAGLVWWLFGTSAHGDVLLCGVGGVAFGSMIAQLHQVRTQSGRRTASLDRRSMQEYLPAAWARRMVVLAALSGVLVVAAATADRPGSAARWGLASLVVLGLVHLVQRRVANRPRPALTAGLQFADDLARKLAIDRGLAQPATYFALVLFAHGAGRLTSDYGGTATAVSVIAWLYALRLWWRNRRLGLDRPLRVERPVAVEV